MHPTHWLISTQVASSIFRNNVADEDVAEILDGAIGLVQSGFKDFGLSSMLFLAVWKSASASGDISRQRRCRPGSVER